MLKGTRDQWHSDKYWKEKEKAWSKCYPVELVEKTQVGSALGDQATVRKLDQDPSENEAEQEAISIYNCYDAGTDVEDFAGHEPVVGVVEGVGHKDDHTEHRGQYSWGVL